MPAVGLVGTCQEERDASESSTRRQLQVLGSLNCTSRSPGGAVQGGRRGCRKQRGSFLGGLERDACLVGRAQLPGRLRPRIATVRHQPALAPLIFTGNEATTKPRDGSSARFASFSIW